MAEVDVNGGVGEGDYGGDFTDPKKIETPQPPFPSSFWSDVVEEPEASGIDVSVSDLSNNINQQRATATSTQSIVDDAAQDAFETRDTITIEQSRALKNERDAVSARVANKQHIDELKKKPSQGRDGIDVYDEDYRKINPPKTSGNDDDHSFARKSTPEKSISGESQSVAVNRQEIKLNIDKQDNILDAYSNYTYNIDLYLLDDDTYNTMVLNPTSIAAVRNRLIISSGDKRYPVGMRNSEFDDTFYIDDLEMKTVTPTTGKSKNTNVTNVSFKIIEPYGVTLLERIENMVRDTFKPGLRPKMYSQLPYLIKITFVGYDKDGVPKKIDNATRYIPVKLTSLTFDANEGGATYAINAVPYNQEAMSTTSIVLPKMIQIAGKTVEDFLNNSVTVFDKVDRDKDKIRNDKASQSARANNSDVAPTTRDVSTYSFESLEDLLNKYYISLTSNNLAAQSRFLPAEMRKKLSTSAGCPGESIRRRDYPDTVEFVFYEDIGKSAIEYDSLQLENIPNTSTYENNAFLQHFVSSISPSSYKLVDKTTLRLNAGTSIIKVIEVIMLHSSYIQDQLKSTDNDKNKPLKWFKITPRVLLGEWDSKIGRFAYKIRYTISPYMVFNINYPKAPRGNPKGNGYHKQYDYIYTGQNTDVLDFDIKYNIAYYRQSTLGIGDEAQEADDPENESGDVNTPVHYSAKPKAVSSGLPDKGQGSLALSARDLAKTVLTEGPEMIGLKLNIIGDPAFIMQSEIYSQDHIDPLNNLPMTAFLDDGTINYDYGDLLINMNFKFPSDYGSDGLMQLAENSSNKYRSSDQFSGIYRVTHVDHTFTGGQFNQTLRGVRLLKTKEKVDVDKINKERKEAQEERQKCIEKNKLNTQYISTVSVTNGSDDVTNGSDDGGEDSIALADYQSRGQLLQDNRQLALRQAALSKNLGGTDELNTKNDVGKATVNQNPFDDVVRDTTNMSRTERARFNEYVRLRNKLNESRAAGLSDESFQQATAALQKKFKYN